MWLCSFCQALSGLILLVGLSFQSSGECVEVCVCLWGGGGGGGGEGYSQNGINGHG